MAPAKVLVVDDEPVICDILRGMLANAGYDPVVETDPHKVMDVLAGAPFNVVLLDLKMPGLSGMQLLRIIKDLHHDLSVLIVTGSVAEEELVEKAVSRAGSMAEICLMGLIRPNTINANDKPTVKCTSKLAEIVNI